MNIFFYLIFGFIEFLLITLITDNLTTITYDYLSIKYTSFKFNIENNSEFGLNIIIKIFFPVIYIIILSGILYKFNCNIYVTNIFFITEIFFAIRWIFILLSNKIKLVNWSNEFMCFIISTTISFIIYIIFISKTTQIFISIDEIRDGIWISIIIFLLHIMFKKIYTTAYINKDMHEFRVNNYILQKYNTFYKKYNNLLNIKNKSIKTLTYSIMIYEDFNRPKSIRILEYIKILFCRNATLGIMQINSDILISDKKSIQLGLEKIKNSYHKHKNLNKEKKLKKVIYDYNNSNEYVNEILYIYNILYKNIK